MPRTPTPWPALSATAIVEDACESGIVNVSRISVLLLARPGDDLAPVGRGLADIGLMVIPVDDPVSAEALNYLPRFAIIETRIPGALDLLRKVVAPPHEVMAIAVLGESESESAALKAGATATLRRPLGAADVLLYVDRFKKHQELLTQSRELFERNEANALVSTTARVTAAICHEVRNPLQAVRLNIGLLQDANDRQGPRLTFEDKQEILKDIDSALNRIDSILTSLNGLARGEKPQVARVDLGEIARDALKSVRGDPGAIEIATQPDVHGVASRGLLQQVIVNVLNNALDAVRKVKEPKVLLRVYATAGEARISIRDNGAGVPSHLRERIFEPFFSTKGEGGTGLGLAIARQAVASMGGALTLSGEEPPGACFRIRLRRG